MCVFFIKFCSTLFSLFITLIHDKPTQSLNVFVYLSISLSVGLFSILCVRFAFNFFVFVDAIYIHSNCSFCTYVCVGFYLHFNSILSHLFLLACLYVHLFSFSIIVLSISTVQLNFKQVSNFVTYIS